MFQELQESNDSVHNSRENRRGAVIFVVFLFAQHQSTGGQEQKESGDDFHCVVVPVELLSNCEPTCGTLGLPRKSQWLAIRAMLWSTNVALGSRVG